MIRKLTLAEVDFDIEILPEDTNPADDFDSGDAEQDAADVAEINRRLEYDLWAWCVVRVVAKWNGFEGDTYLGGCSYDGPADFKAGGYYEQMQEEALADLNLTLAGHAAKIAALEIAA
jgi:hypothetical protein